MPSCYNRFMQWYRTDSCSHQPYASQSYATPTYNTTQAHVSNTRQPPLSLPLQNSLPQILDSSLSLCQISFPFNKHQISIKHCYFSSIQSRFPFLSLLTAKSRCWFHSNKANFIFLPNSFPFSCDPSLLLMFFFFWALRLLGIQNLCYWV